MSTISGVCSKCGKESDKLHVVDFSQPPARLCDGCNEKLMRLFLQWVVGAADAKDKARKEFYDKADLPNRYSNPKG